MIASNKIRPVTLLAKKVLPKKARAHTNPMLDANIRPVRYNQWNVQKRYLTEHNHRKSSPIRVTITSKLNPDAAPFYAQPRVTTATPIPNPSIKFYGNQRFRPQGLIDQCLVPSLMFRRISPHKVSNTIDFINDSFLQDKCHKQNTLEIQQKQPRTIVFIRHHLPTHVAVRQHVP
jgi:hypothetical protein